MIQWLNIIKTSTRILEWISVSIVAIYWGNNVTYKTGFEKSSPYKETNCAAGLYVSAAQPIRFQDQNYSISFVNIGYI